MRRSLAVALLCLGSVPAWAQGASDARDSAIFGESLSSPAAVTESVSDREDAMFAGQSAEPAISEGKLQRNDDKLQLGGMMFLRSNVSLSDGERLQDQRVSTPNLVDLYLDSRPSEDLRGFIRGRLLWNPSLDEATATRRVAELQKLAQNIPGTDLLTLSAPKRTRVVLNELWLKFNLARSVFVTVGQQNIRWGVARVWNPADIINAQRRVALTLFDERTGIPLIKFHMPVESLGWNFYLIGMLENLNSLDRAGVGARAELVSGTLEVAMSTIARRHEPMRLAADLSAGIWELDLKSEVGVALDKDAPGDLDKAIVQATFGAEYGVKYSDEDVMYLGLEYFYNHRGVDRFDGTTFVQKVFVERSAQFLYYGKHYGAGYIALPNPGSFNDITVNASLLAALSDGSYATRLDISQQVMTFMRLQAFVMFHFGDPGELRFGRDAIGEQLADQMAPLLYLDQDQPRLNNPTFELGLWLRIDL